MHRCLPFIVQELKYRNMTGSCFLLWMCCLDVMSVKNIMQRMGLVLSARASSHHLVELYGGGPRMIVATCFRLGAGRTIIRHLAYKAGIPYISSGALKLAETELVHTLAVLLVEGYESSVEMAKHTQYLEPDEPLSYGLRHDSIDMFYVPPPPLRTLTEDDVEQTVYTIVPGQISVAAEKRNIQPNKVYGCFLSEESEEREMSYYYKQCMEPDPEAPGSDCLKENVVVSSSGGAGAEITQSTTNCRRSGTLFDYYSKK